MSGNRRRGLILQARDLHLLRELDILRVIDREQAKKVAGFRSNTQVNARLLALVRAGFLQRIFIGSTAHGRKGLYALAASGAAQVQARFPTLRLKQEQLLVKNLLIVHQMHINAVYVAAKYEAIPVPGTTFRRWIRFVSPLLAASPIIPDGYCELAAAGNVRCLFLEIDMGTEPMPVWQNKTQFYLQLAISGEFAKRFGQPQFRVLVLAPTVRRLHSIRATVSKSTDKVFWFTTLDNIHGGRLWSSVWFRPAGDQQVPLFGS